MELLYIDNDKMEKPFIRLTLEAAKTTSKKGATKAFIKADKKSPTNEKNAIRLEWDHTIINGLMTNETIVKALDELEEPDKENVKPIASQINIANYIKGMAKNWSGKPRPAPTPTTFQEAMNSSKMKNFIGGLANCTDFNDRE